MPQNNAPNLKMGQNGKNGAFWEDFTRESFMPDSPHSPLMGQNLKNGAKLLGGELLQTGRKNGAKLKKWGKSQEFQASQNVTECHRMSQNHAFCDKKMSQNQHNAPF